MQTTKTIDLAGQARTVRELSVGDLARVLGDLSAPGPLELYYKAVHPDVTATMVELSAGLDAEAQAALLPDELELVVAAVMEVNSRFLARVGAAAAAAGDEA